MKGTNLGELEELLMLTVANLGKEAYGLAIKQYISQKCNRSISISTVHATLHRLQEKGYLTSEYDSSDLTERGGRPKLVFKITSNGRSVLNLVKELRNKLWSTIPDWST